MTKEMGSEVSAQKKQQKVRLIITFLKFLDKISTAYNKFKKIHKEQKKKCPMYYSCPIYRLQTTTSLPTLLQHHF
jgi:hypothetical protein